MPVCGEHTFAIRDGERSVGGGSVFVSQQVERASGRHERWRGLNPQGVDDERRLRAICRPCHASAYVGNGAVDGRVGRRVDSVLNAPDIHIPRHRKRSSGAQPCDADRHRVSSRERVAQGMNENAWSAHEV